MLPKNHAPIDCLIKIPSKEKDGGKGRGVKNKSTLLGTHSKIKNSRKGFIA